MRQDLTVSVKFTLSKPQVERLVNRAILWGFVKNNERNRWTDADRKEAIRYIVKKLTEEDVR